MKMFNKRGITMIALVITITVSLILTAAVVMTGSKVPETAELATFMNDISILQENISTKLMTNKYKDPNDPYAENNKWIGIISEDSFDENGVPIFDIPLSLGEETVNVALLSTALLDSVSMTEAQLAQYYVDAQGNVYHQGKTINGVTYYTKTITSGTPSQNIPSDGVTTRYIITFYTNGGVINSGSVTRYTPGSSVLLPTDVTKLGYIFEGWYDNNDCTGTAITEILSEDTGNKTFYAKWVVDPTVTVSSVTLNTNGGTINSGNLTSYVEGTGALLPSNITRTGWTFGGWYDNSGLSGNVYTSITQSDTGNKVFYAKWTEVSGEEETPTTITRSVSLYTNGGIINSGIINSYIEGIGATLPTDIVKDGYTFAGWYTNSTFLGNPVYSITTTDTGNKAYYAKWDISGGSSTPSISYRVTLNSNGGIIMSGDISSYTTGTATALPTNVVREGYQFGGWFSSSAFVGSAITHINSTDTGDKIYYAKWNAIYSISFETFGGTINSGNINNYIYGVGATLPTNVTNTNYIFGGWYENASFTGSSVTSIPINAVGPKTFYAKWESNLTSATYIVTLDAMGGTINSGNVSSYVQGTQVTLPTDVTRIGYSFQGWYDNNTFQGNPITNIYTSDTGNKIYYAKWIVGTYQLTIHYWNEDGDTIRSSYSTTLNYGSTYSVISPVISGYSSDRDVVSGTMGYTNQIIIVTYSVKEYLISYELNGGTINSGIVTSYQQGRAVQLPTDVIKDGYIFDGWYDNSALSGNPVTAIYIADIGNKIFYAKWILLNYELTINYVRLDGTPMESTYTARVNYGASYSITSPIISGYGCTHPVVSGTMGAEDLAVTVVYSNSFGLILHSNGGTINSGNTNNYIYGVEYILPTDMTKAESQFLGWYTTEDFSGDPVTKITTTDTGDKEYWAKWIDVEAPVINGLTAKYNSALGEYYVSGTSTTQNILVEINANDEASGVSGIEWKEEGDNIWSENGVELLTISGTQKFYSVLFDGNVNSKIYFRCVDNEGNATTETNDASITINQDARVPEVTTFKISELIATSPTTFNAKVMVMANDIGGSGIVSYKFKTNEDAEWTTSSLNNYVYTFSGLNIGTTYTLSLRITDNAGNEVTYDIDGVNIVGLTGDNTTATITPSSDDGYTKQVVEVVINSTSTVKDYGYIQYSIDSTDGTDGTWTTYNDKISLLQNCSIYARAMLNDNIIGTPQNIATITHIDQERPVITFETTENTATINMSDVGVSGLSSGINYEYYLSTSSTRLTGGSWQSYLTNVPITVTSNETGKYYIFIEQVLDNAGNISNVNDVIINGEHYMAIGPFEFVAIDDGTPSLTIESSVGEETIAKVSPNNIISYAFLWNRDVTGFEQSDITVTNGTITNFVGSGKSYMVTVTYTGACTQTVEVATNVAQASNENENLVGANISVNILDSATTYTTWTDIVTTQPEGYVVSGDGNTITISSAQGLAWLASCVNGQNGQTANQFYNKTINLTTDVDLSEYYWTPIGREDATRFRGTFDGQNHVISGMRIDMPTVSLQALFGYVGVANNNPGGTIKNLTVQNSSIVGKDHVASVVAIIQWYSNIINVKSIDNYIKANGSYAGGVVSYLHYYSKMDRCYSNSVVEGNQSVGGLIGYSLTYTTLVNSGAEGIVKAFAADSRVGAIIGWTNDRAYTFNCYGAGAVYGASQVGGLIGRHEASSHIGTAYTSAKVIGTTTSYVGGVIGYQGAGIEYCFWNNDCLTSGGNGATANYSYKFTKDGNEYTLSSSLSMVRTSTTDLFTYLTYWSMYYDKQHSFHNNTNRRYSSWIVDKDKNNGYPIIDFDNDNYCDKAVQEITPDINDGKYYINNAEQLSWIVGVVNGTITTGNIPTDRSFLGKTIVLNNDIDFNEIAIQVDEENKQWKIIPGDGKSMSYWYPLGQGSTYPFKGTFEGNNNSISGIIAMKYNLAYQGMFGYCLGATIKDLNIENGYVIGTQFIGGVSGYITNNTTISNCTSNLFIVSNHTSADGQIGGIVGYNNSCSIINSTNYSFIESRTANVGGIAGYSNVNSTLTNCNNYGRINAYQYTGGLFGIVAQGTQISNCNNYGYVDGVYYDSNCDRYIGGVIGHASSATVSNCNNYATVHAMHQVGGIIGYSASTNVTNCKNFGEVISTSSYVGGIIGRTAGGTISHCSNYVDISNLVESDIGGILGSLEGGLVEYCNNSNEVEGLDSVGGIVGYMNSATSMYCNNHGMISGRNNVGGVIGYTYNAVVDTCYNTALISGNQTGGIVGYMYAFFGNCFTRNCGNSGNIVGENSNVGGIVGRIYRDRDTVALYNSYNTGNVTGIGSNVGGIAGHAQNVNNIENCYNSGILIGNSYTGDIVGYYVSGGVLNNYYIESDWNSAGYGTIGVNYAFTGSNTTWTLNDNIVMHGKIVVSDLQMVLNKWAMDRDLAIYRTWKTDNAGTNKGFPIQAEAITTYTEYTEVLPDPEDGVYYINTIKDLVWLAGVVNGTITGGTIPNDISFTGKTIKLNADIYMNNDTIYYRQDENNNWHLCMRDNALTQKWVPIGKLSYPFKGTFDGQGNSIQGMYIQDTAADYQGLFGLTMDANIKNLNIENSYIYVRHYSGLLVGQANNTDISGINLINNIVRGGSQLGGLVGRTEANGTEVTNIENVNSIDTVISSGSEHCGGIIGYNNSGTIMNVINTGLVHITSNNVGGISGLNTANTKVNKCYNYGDVYGASQVGGILGNTITTDQVKCNNYGKIVATGNYVGGINGSSESTTNISFCNNYNEIIGSSYIGGITGDTTSSVNITNCTNDSLISGASNIGGIIGYNYNYSRLTDSTNSGPINATGTSIGGIVGVNDNNAIIENCINTETADITSTNSQVGGIVGYNVTSAYVRDCTNLADVVGTTSVGGIVGYNHNSAVVYNSYTIGNAQMTTSSGGTAGLICGNNNAYIRNCYGEGTVTGNGGHIGGVVGYNLQHIFNCYAKSSIVGNNNVGIIAGYSDNANLKYCYGQSDIAVLKSAGNTDMSYCKTFTIADNVGTLNSSITINSVPTTDLLTALNLWVNSNTINPPYYEWIEDTQNINNGYPIFDTNVE